MTFRAIHSPIVISTILLLLGLAGHPDRVAAQPVPVMIDFLNLDPESGPLTAGAKLREGGTIEARKAGYGERRISNVEETDEQPEQTWIVDTAGQSYAGDFPLSAHYTYLVAYGGGRTIVVGNPEYRAGVTNVVNRTFDASFRSLNGSAATLRIAARAHTNFPSNPVSAALANYHASVRLSDGSWWLLHGSPISPSFFISEADDTIAVGENESTFDPASWAIRIDTTTDSGRVRLVNATGAARTSLFIDGVEQASCGAFGVAPSVATMLGQRRLEIRAQGGSILMDTIIVLYPHIHLDIIIALDAEGGVSRTLSERITSRLAPHLTRRSENVDYPYWSSMFRVVAAPTGSLVGATIAARDTALRSFYEIRVADTPISKEGAHMNPRSFDVIDANGSIRQRYEPAGGSIDSTVFLFLDVGGEITLQTYDEFDEGAQELRRLEPSQVAEEVSYPIQVASLSQRYDTLEVEIDGSDIGPDAWSRWLSDRVGEYTGITKPFTLRDRTGASIAQDVLTGSPGGSSMLLIDDDPFGTVRTLSYPVAPLFTPRTFRVVNFTEGVGPIVVTAYDDADRILIGPIDEGEMGYPENAGTASFLGVVRTMSGDSLFPLSVPNNVLESSFVVDGGIAEGNVNLYLILGNNSGRDDTLRPIQSAGILSGVARSMTTNGSFRLVPNPATSSVAISVEEPSSRARAIDVIDALGRIVAITELPAEEKHSVLDVSSFPPGTYSVVVHSVEGHSRLIRRLVVIR